MKNKSLLSIYKVFLFILISTIGCSSVSKTEKDQSIPERIVIWNESDSESIADSLISISLQAEWNKNFSQKRKPIIVVGKMENKSKENIDVSLLAKDIERSLINSGEVSFISSKEKREIIRADRKNFEDFAEKDKFIKYMKPLKADFFMSGVVYSQVDSSVTPIRKKYELSLNIISTKNATVVWEGVQSITK